jgi:hypothetical protein
MVGLFLLPSFRLYAWLPLLLDAGTLCALLAFPGFMNSWWQTSSWNLITEYRARNAEKEVSLRLFRNNNFVLEQTWEPKSVGIKQTRMNGSWRATETGLSLQIGEQEAEFVYDGEALRQQSGFPHCFQDKELSLADLSFEHG